MKTICLRYSSKQALMSDAKALFPDWNEIKKDLTGFDKHGYWTEVYNDKEQLIAVDVYLLVADDFDPAWMAGTLRLPTEHTHGFMGHEIPVPDAPGEPPDNAVII